MTWRYRWQCWLNTYDSFFFFTLMILFSRCVYFKISPSIKQVFDHIQYWYTKHMCVHLSAFSWKINKNCVWRMNFWKRARKQTRERERKVEWGINREKRVDTSRYCLLLLFGYLARDVNFMTNLVVLFIFVQQFFSVLKNKTK